MVIGVEQGRLTDYLYQALVIKAIRARSDKPMKGAAIAALRQSIWQGDVTPDESIPVDSVRKAIYSLGVEDMPPPSDLVSTLVETLSQKMGNVGVKPAWEAIGVKGRTGEELMRRTAKSVNWPVWKTLRDAALEE